MAWTEEDRMCSTCGKSDSVDTDTGECGDCDEKRYRLENGLSMCCGGKVNSLDLCANCGEPCGDLEAELSAFDAEAADRAINTVLNRMKGYVGCLILAAATATIFLAPILLTPGDLPW